MERLTREMARVSLPFLRTSFKGMELETMTKGVNTLKQWTGKANANIIFDSTVDEVTGDGLFNKTKGRQNIALVGSTTDWDVFGGFNSIVVI